LTPHPKALEWYLKSFRVLLNVLGFEHPNTKTGFNNMADAYENSNQPEPFEEWLRSCL
jgi:hypothetical protein